MSVSTAKPSSGSAASPGSLERRVFKIVKVDTPRGMDFLQALAREVDGLRSDVTKLLNHFGIE